jgi:hypothetical protein
VGTLKTRLLTTALLVAAPLLAGRTIPRPEAPASALAALSEKAFFLGREYFVERSGRAQLVVEADRADLGPAFTWLLFDARNPAQSERKAGAFNFVAGQGFVSSALVVRLGGCSYTALGHRTQTRWIVEGGIPAAEAVWWAGGVRVTERIHATAREGVFVRSILLDGRGLGGPDCASLVLGLPAPADVAEAGIVAGPAKGARIALVVRGAAPAVADPRTGTIEAGPFAVRPGAATRVDTLLVARIGPGVPADELALLHSLRTGPLEPVEDRTRADWARDSRVSTPDATVAGIFDKARFGLPGMVADDGSIDAGIFEYGLQWVRDTSNTTLGLLQAGRFELARATLERLLTKMVRDDGTPMAEGRFEPPDMEELDEMGELMNVVLAYRNWTGDDSLVREHRAQLLALVERPLGPRFRDADGLVHGRREYWERTLDDAYEFVYQTYLVLGLRDAAELAGPLGAGDRAPAWRAQAERTLEAMLHHPRKALVDRGALIKRRALDGTLVDELVGHRGHRADAPNATETHRRIEPDAEMALPIALGIVDPRSDLARRTLDRLEELWNARWSDGGYDRYNTESEPDTPGPWPFATAFILRAQHEAGLFERSRRSLEWLDTVQGGRTGAWFEEIPSTRSAEGGCALIPWTSGEVTLFVVHHYLGVGFENGAPVIRPALYPGSPPVSADLRFREGRLRLLVDGSGPALAAKVDGAPVAVGADGAVRLPADFKGGLVEIRCAGAGR